EVKPGEPYLYTNLFGEKIVNFPTKDHWKSLSRIEYIVKGLDLFLKKYKEWGIESIAFPPLGCGNGGLNWTEVGPIMFQKLASLDIDVEIFAPYGTPKEQLKKEFLQSHEVPGKKAALPMTTLKPGWVAILEILHRLEQMQYTQYVGRTLFQKICYVATRAGLQTGFQFSQNSYGPFSHHVTEMEKILSNANFIQESQLGSMIRICTGSEYPVLRNRFREHIMAQNSEIDRIVDLFSRIKNTRQAEEVTTVLYAVEDLTSGNVNKLTTEQDFFDYIVDWKKHWDTPEKKQSLANTIRNLVLMGWISIDYSRSLPVSDNEFAEAFESN
ncbi:MAG: macro domain-containing protein, partial [Candidatus Cloacimonadaceae bacterium]|nr:macro domain-containing protein [Candidatus Cloacimonadaceae bacterium]